MLTHSFWSLVGFAALGAPATNVLRSSAARGSGVARDRNWGGVWERGRLGSDWSGAVFGDVVGAPDSVDDVVFFDEGAVGVDVAGEDWFGHVFVGL